MRPWDRLQDALGDLTEYAEETLRAVPRVQRYTEWAVPALADLTAIACELADTKLEQMEADRRLVWGWDGFGAAWAAETTLDTYPELKRLTRHNLDQLRQFGYIPWGAGLATVVQGVKSPDFVPRLTPLARAWQHAGLRFPIAPFVVWHPHVPVLGAAS
jgi:hypothetical protein